MTNKDKPETTGAPHEATWGMTEHGKREWDAKNGNRIRREAATKSAKESGE